MLDWPPFLEQMQFGCDLRSIMVRRSVLVKLGTAALLVTVARLFWPKGPPLSPLEKHIQSRNTRDVRYVLMWTHPWNRTAEGIQDGLRVEDCVFTYDRTKLRDASAVVFHYSSLDNEVMPWQHYRDYAQRFVFYSIESPSYIRNAEHRDLEIFGDHFINWTMNYRRDSDVYYPYPAMGDEFLNAPPDHVEKLMADKSELALWVVSNCDFSDGSKRRMEYVETLVKAGLRVHRYGACFHNGGEYNAFTLKQHRAFKFYLSFENALHCRDYITEKFWANALAAGRVPVVWGPTKEDVTRVAPPNSFIFAEDFATPEALVEYLDHLDRHDDEYRAYLRWIEHPETATKLLYRRLKNSRERALCQRLKTDEKPKSYASVASFLFVNEYRECLL